MEAPDPGVPRVPESLLARIRQDPVHAPEYIALAASEQHGPAARKWVAEQRTSPEKMAKRARKVHARYARLTGAATGVGGIITMVPDVAAAIWIQSRLVFFIAAAYGYDPLDRMRPAELLVLYELYANPSDAREALDGAGKSMAEAAVGKALSGSRDDDPLLSRLTSMLVRRGARRLAGRAIPGFAIIVNSVGNERAVRDIGARAIRFYGG
jgi:hypothetical protein